MSNKIVLENLKQGNPESEWDLTNGASNSIEGFTTDISYNIGETVDFKIASDSDTYRIDIYRLGYYGGDGARLVTSLTHAGTVDQPAPLVDSTTGLVDAGNWSVTDTWTIPDDIVSGVFIAKLTRLDGTAGENHIPFVIRDDTSSSDVLFQTDDTTWQAYNTWGGNSLYDVNGTVAVSYNRPFSNRFADADAGTSANPINFVFGTTYPAIRWLEANGYDVTYSSGVDTARYGANLLQHDVFLTSGHDEYWSGTQRTNVEAARDAGVNLVFWSGNDVFWKTRWEPSIDGSQTDYRTLICYKTSDFLRQDDPTGEWTGLWRDPDGYAAGAAPENQLTGTMYMVNLDANDPYEALVVDSDYAALRFWRNTAVAGLTAGSSITLPEIIGYEWNVDADNGYRPGSLVHLSSTTAATAGIVSDADYIQYTLPDPPGYATHNLTMYRADSGALVFSAGTIAWAWALDAHHDGTATPTDDNIQQAMVNMLADMGVQPATIQAGLVIAAASTDATAPVASVSTLSLMDDGAGGTAAKVTGTARDLGGGVVAGVAISADGGSTWHPALGTAAWSYSWTTNGASPTSIMVKAIDDSINVGTVANLFSGDKLTELSRFGGFTTTDGWNNTAHSRMLFDVNGDGIRDFVGFGDSAVYVHLGAVDAATGAIYFSAEQALDIGNFCADQGYSATSQRGIAYVGNHAGGPGESDTQAPVIWGQTASGIAYYSPINVDGAINYSAAAQEFGHFGTTLGWGDAEHRLQIAFVSAGNAATGIAADANASILGFGYAGLTLAPQGFQAGRSVSDAYLVQGSQGFGFDAGWNEVLDIRAVTDYRGNEIDLNRDGILDVVAIGTPGVVYAFGQQTGSGQTGPGTYSLGPTHVAQIDPSGSSAFNRDWGWNNAETMRKLADVNGDGFVDIVGFGNAGVYVSLGRTPAADGSAAFGITYLAIAAYGNDDGWSNATHERALGDVNGDGLLDIIGFGDKATIISTGSVNAQTGQLTWTYASAIFDYDVSQSWDNTMHMRQVIDLDGNGTDEIVVSGDLALQLFWYGL